MHHVSVARPERTTAYGPDAAQVYDVRLPTRHPQGVTVVVIHGGFWRAIHDRSHAAGQAQGFADAGYHVAVLEYRRTGMPGGGWPGTLHDVLTALNAVAADRDLPTEMVLVGHSAGGHLSALAASHAERPSTVVGAVCLAGVLDLELGRALNLGQGAIEAFLGERPITTAPDADPAALRPGIPVIALHGVNDIDVPPQVSESYVEIQRGRPGVDVRLDLVEDCEHYGLIDPEHPAFARVLNAISSLHGA